MDNGSVTVTNFEGSFKPRVRILKYIHVRTCVYYEHVLASIRHGGHLLCWSRVCILHYYYSIVRICISATLLVYHAICIEYYTAYCSVHAHTPRIRTTLLLE